MTYNKELQTLKDLSDEAYLDEIFRMIEGELLFEKEPTAPEKRAIAAEWISARWLEIKAAVCAQRRSIEDMSFENYLASFCGIAGPLLIDRPSLSALATAHLVALWTYRNGLNMLCKSDKEDANSLN